MKRFSLDLCKLSLMALVIAAVPLTGCGQADDAATAPADDAAAADDMGNTATAEPASYGEGGPVIITAPADAPPCPVPPPCGDDCSNVPFEPTECATTPHAAAGADIVVGNPLESPNMLYCEGGVYALCFFSGPSYATGRPDVGNVPLPCVMDGEVADCTCLAFSTGPYFVDINGILNLGAYYETVETCGHDGSKCANIANCGRDGSTEGCEDQTPAPVCGYVAAQDPNDDRVSLIPGADLISTFSFAMDDDYQLGTTQCDGLYAGCMTAPCYYDGEGTPSDGDPVQCYCPTFNGTFQVGQLKQQCEFPPGEGEPHYVWSASNTVPAENPAGE